MNGTGLYAYKGYSEEEYNELAALTDADKA
jgi:hypothetical protein